MSSKKNDIFNKFTEVIENCKPAIADCYRSVIANTLY